jgi:hypothetical protein
VARARLRLRNNGISALCFRGRPTLEGYDPLAVDPVSLERRLVMLLVLLDIHNRTIQDFHVIPNIDRSSRFTLKLKDPWLHRGERLTTLSNLWATVGRVCGMS